MQIKTFEDLNSPNYSLKNSYHLLKVDMFYLLAYKKAI